MNHHDCLCNHHDHDDASYRRAFDLLTRRNFLRVGALTVGGLMLAPRLRAQPASNARAKAVIQLFLFGGPSHVDTYDPKPGAGPDFSGPWRNPIGTNVDGIQIGQLLPLTAKQADKYSILRGLSHKTNSHETGTYMMQTGTPAGSGLVYPSQGAVVAYKMRESGALKGRSLPPYITVPIAIGRFSECGFLGPKYKTFIPGSLSNKPSEKETLELTGKRDLLASLDSYGDAHKDLFEENNYYRDQATEMVLGQAREAFDISKEPEHIRKLYGDSDTAKACLQARRLVENGVVYVTVNMRGWDTHRDQAERYKKLMPELDQAYSALITDLSQRGMLDSTIVTCGGEFGRTPKFMTDPPWNGGRNHFGAAFSWLIAGGGFRGGQVLGKTDNRGEKVIERAIAPWDLTGTIYQLLGIDPNGTLPHPTGCAAYVTPRNDDPATKEKSKAGSKTASSQRGASVPGEGLLTELLKA
jgi:uncharacterized protein (DUF1501 family)